MLSLLIFIQYCIGPSLWITLFFVLLPLLSSIILLVLDRKTKGNLRGLCVIFIFIIVISILLLSTKYIENVVIDPSPIAVYDNTSTSPCGELVMINASSESTYNLKGNGKFFVLFGDVNIEGQTKINDYYIFYILDSDTLKRMKLPIDNVTHIVKENASYFTHTNGSIADSIPKMGFMGETLYVHRYNTNVGKFITAPRYCQQVRNIDKYTLFVDRRYIYTMER